MTGEMFKAYTETVSRSDADEGATLCSWTTSVFHKVDGIEEAIEARGGDPIFISPHTSPRF